MLALICIFLLIGLGTCIEENSSSALSNDSLHLHPMGLIVNETDYVRPGINLPPANMQYGILINTGIACFERGEYFDALGYFKKAAVLDKDRPEAWYNEAAALGELNRSSEAYAAIIKYLEIVPGDQDAENFRDGVLGQMAIDKSKK